MGKTENGPMGSARGKVGPLVYYKWKDKDCVRSRPRVNKKRKLSTDEKKNRGKFGYTQKFLSILTEVLRLGFHNYSKNQTAFNSAMSYTLNNAVKSDDNGFYIDHSLFHISKGIGSPLTGATITYEDGILSCHWDYDPKTVNGDGFFRTLFIAIPEDPNLDVCGDILNKDLTHRQEDMIIPASPDKDKLYHIHLGFVATDHSNQRIDSIYVGTVTA
ncbi:MULTISPECIES: DUF6266 family protein [Sphingobacterium]|uniref:DUF6266 family protein n=1 Tax=Sphingobacterium TaxID=28453 RepID=UPI0013D925C1|nr:MULTISPECIES: DUF6266 family protein [unclassified Sphingobacterium]